MAYNSVLTERRRLLHGRIGAAMEKLHADHIEDHLAELAHHFARSADTAKAVEYLLKAGQNAAQRSATREALERLELGLKLIESLPAGPARDQQELALRVAVYLPMVLVRGFAVADVEVNLGRAWELCEQVGAPAAPLLQVLFGLCNFYFFSGKIEMARSLSTQILALGAERGDEIVSLTGHFDLGVSCELAGEYRTAAASLERSVAIGERRLPNCAEPLGPHVMTIVANGHNNLSWTLWMLGYPEQALRQIDRLHARPERIWSKYDAAPIIYGDLITRCLYLRDYRGAREKAESLIALGREQGFSYWEAAGSIFLGLIAVREGAVDEGIKMMLHGTEVHRSSGDILSLQRSNSCLAQAYLAAGRFAEGIASVEEAFAADQVQNLKADLQRLKGELLVMAGAPESEAEALMREAIAIAQRQEAKGWELRAATSLARLLRKQGRIAEAREVLAPVYNWFTEGFDTADLKDARALLDEL